MGFLKSHQMPMFRPVAQWPVVVTTQAHPHPDPRPLSHGHGIGGTLPPI